MADIHERMGEMLKALKTKCKSAGGAKALAQMLEKMDRETEKHVLATLKQQDPQMAKEIEDRFFSFEDLAQMEDAVLKRALEEAHRSTLALSLKGVDETIRLKVMNNLSKRAAEMLEDDMLAMGPKPKPAVEEAQREVAKTLRRWKNVIL